MCLGAPSRDACNPTSLCPQQRAPGKVLFDAVCNHLNLVEGDYFGLEFPDHRKIVVGDMLPYRRLFIFRVGGITASLSPCRSEYEENTLVYIKIYIWLNVQNACNSNLCMCQRCLRGGRPETAPSTLPPLPDCTVVPLHIHPSGFRIKVCWECVCTDTAPPYTEEALYSTVFIS